MTQIDLSSLKVLVVSADSYGLKTLRIALHMIELRDIAIAQDSAQAMTLLRGGDYSALICDGEQPDVEGVPFTIAVRRIERTRYATLPVILVSATPRRSLVSSARARGVNAVLARPISAASVARALSLATKAQRRVAFGRSSAEPRFRSIVPVGP